MISLLVLSMWGADASKPEQLPAPKRVDADLTGIYRSVSTERGDDKKILAVVTVQRRGDVYLFSWHGGPVPIRGVGTIKGDALSVGWVQPTPDGKTVVGVTVYSLAARTMRGRWASAGSGGEEVLTWLGSLEE